MKTFKGKEETAASKSAPAGNKEIDPDPIRPDLAEVIARHSFGLDENRPAAVAKRQQKNQRTARANVEDLCDAGRFLEYGALAIAAQRGRRSEDDLINKTPTDGLIAGIGSVNCSLFGDDKARCMVMAYDYTVLAGTQGYFNHKKMDRMLKLAHEQRLPLVFFAEGWAMSMLPESWWRGWIYLPLARSPGSAGMYRWSASYRGHVLRATPLCWAAAM